MKKTTKDFKNCKILDCFILYVQFGTLYNVKFNACAHVRTSRAHSVAVIGGLATFGVVLSQRFFMTLAVFLARKTLEGDQ